LGISFCLFCFRRYFTKFTQLFNTERYIPSAWADFVKIEFLSMLQLFTALTLKIVASGALSLRGPIPPEQKGNYLPP
jgi:hypothetical protein